MITQFSTPVVIKGEIRGGGSGSSAKVARIIGLDDRFGFKREFLQSDRSLISGSGKSGSFRWHITEPGVYELRDIQYAKGVASIGTLDSGFVAVDANGEMTRITREEAISRAALQDQAAS